MHEGGVRRFLRCRTCSYPCWRIRTQPYTLRPLGAPFDLKVRRRLAGYRPIRADLHRPFESSSALSGVSSSVYV